MNRYFQDFWGRLFFVVLNAGSGICDAFVKGKRGSFMSVIKHSVQNYMVPHVATPLPFPAWLSRTVLCCCVCRAQARACLSTGWVLSRCFAWAFGTVSVLGGGGGVRHNSVCGSELPENYCDWPTAVSDWPLSLRAQRSGPRPWTFALACTADATVVSLADPWLEQDITRHSALLDAHLGTAGRCFGVHCPRLAAHVTPGPGPLMPRSRHYCAAPAEATSPYHKALQALQPSPKVVAAQALVLGRAGLPPGAPYAALHVRGTDYGKVPPLHEERLHRGFAWLLWLNKVEFAYRLSVSTKAPSVSAQAPLVSAQLLSTGQPTGAVG